MSESLDQQFAECVHRLNSFPFDRSTESGSLRWKLYGLHKQATEGNCRRPCPPRENVILTLKWESWRACDGWSQDEAKREFVADFNTFIASTPGSVNTDGVTNVGADTPNLSTPASQSSAPASTCGTPMTTPASPGVGTRQSTTNHESLRRDGDSEGLKDVVKEGVLYEQRDVFVGWCAKPFILNRELLMVRGFDSAGGRGSVGRKPMKIVGCSVVKVKPVPIQSPTQTTHSPNQTAQPPTEVQTQSPADTDSTSLTDAESSKTEFPLPAAQATQFYYPFVVTHPRMTLSYDLACTTEEERDAWVTTIELLATPPTLSHAPSQSPIVATVNSLTARTPTNQAVGGSSKPYPAALQVSGATTPRQLQSSPSQRGLTLATQATIFVGYSAVVYLLLPSAALTPGLQLIIAISVVYNAYSLYQIRKKSSSRSRTPSSDNTLVPAPPPPPPPAASGPPPASMESVEIFAGSGLPQELRVKAEAQYTKYFPYFSLDDTGASGWQPFFEEQGVVAHCKVDTDGLCCVRGEAMIPLPPKSILRFVTRIEKMNVINPKVVQADILRVYSTHAFARQIKLEKQSIFQARFLHQVSHWCLLPDSRLLIHAWSDNLDSLSTAPDNHVRAEVHYQALLIEPRGIDGCFVTMFLKVDSKVPLSATMQMKSPNVRNAPMTIINVRNGIMADSCPFKNDFDCSHEGLESVTNQTLLKIGVRGSGSGAGSVLSRCSVEGVPEMNTTLASSGLPAQYIARAEAVVGRYFALFDLDSSWESWFTEEGVAAHRKQEGDTFCVRGEGLIQAPFHQVFRFLLDPPNLKVANPQIEYAEKIKPFSANATSLLLKFEKIPMNIVAQRYFILLLHWALLPDGKAIIHAWSEQLDDLHAPLDEGMIRGTFHYNAFLIEPLGAQGCKLTYVAKIDLNGSVPSWVVGTALRGAPLAIANTRKYLLKRLTPRTPIDTISTFEDLSAIGKEVFLGELTPASMDGIPALKPPLSSSGFPAQYVPRSEAAVSKYYGMYELDSSWETWFTEDGVTAHRKQEGDSFLIRGEGVIQAPLNQIFRFLLEAPNMKIANPQIEYCEKITAFTANAWSILLKFEKIPLNVVAQRYFVELMHWCVLPDGKVVIHAWSERLDDLHPPLDDGMVRGEFHYNGFLIEPLKAQGCKVTYAAKIDLNGSVPSWVVGVALRGAPMAIANTRKHLVKKLSPGSKLDVISSFEELTVIAEEVIMGKRAKGGEAPPAVAVETARDRLISATMTRALVGPMAVLVLFYFAPSWLWPLLAVLFIRLVWRVLVYVCLGAPRHEERTPSTLGGRITLRIPIDLGKPLRYLELLKVNTGVEVKLTHLVVKAVAVALRLTPAMSGHMFMGAYYPSRKTGVDVSVSVELSEGRTALAKVCDADSRPADEITLDLQAQTKALRRTRVQSASSNYSALIPLEITEVVSGVVATFSALGFDWPRLGLVGYPQGECSVVMSLDRDGEQDLDISLGPDMPMGSGCAPVVVTVGGIRVQTKLDEERRLLGTPVINVAVSVSCEAASVTEARKFTAKLQSLLNNPSTLD